MDVITHYDMLINENNDPFRDEPILQEYMDKWDGKLFLDALKLDKTKNVLEIGIGTGRLAVKVLPWCKKLTGIDISPKTINRAKENLKEHININLICDDFITHDFEERFDIIYSSLTFMHFEDKRSVIVKIDTLLNKGGVFCLSIDKNQDEYIDVGTRKLKVYPDTPDNMTMLIEKTNMNVSDVFETESAYIIVSNK